LAGGPDGGKNIGPWASEAASMNVPKVSSRVSQGQLETDVSAGKFAGGYVYDVISIS
jgi:hypothetical protein